MTQHAGSRHGAKVLTGPIAVFQRGVDAISLLGAYLAAACLVAMVLLVPELPSVDEVSEQLYWRSM